MDAERHNLWRARVLHWRSLYPDSRFKIGQYVPRAARATPLRCRKCSSTTNVTRHHKGHEYLFATFMPEWYASRYIRFVPADWVPLCSTPCHSHIHDLYAPIVDEIKEYFSSCILSVDTSGPAPVFTWRHRPDRKVLESFRKRLIAKCDWWLARKNRKTRRGKYKDHR